jgi:hypothetical protein
MPRCASWLVTPLQMPLGGEVVAVAGVAIAKKPPTITGTTNAWVALRLERFDVVAVVLLLIERAKIAMTD